MKEMKEYKKGNAFAFDNFREARQWANKPGAEWKRGLVLGSHIEALEQVYGPPKESFQGSEYEFSVWTLDYDGLTIHLLSAPGKGCCMEVELPAGTTPWTDAGSSIGARLPAFLDSHLAALEAVLGKRKCPTAKKRAW